VRHSILRSAENVERLDLQYFSDANVVRQARDQDNHGECEFEVPEGDHGGIARLIGLVAPSPNHLVRPTAKSLLDVLHQA